jgi:hypothetical protein
MTPALRLQVLAARQQLEAVRMQVDVVAAALDGLLAAIPIDCQHPDDARVDASTLTKPRRYWCRNCQSFNDAPLDEVSASPSGLRP